jgi:hypothetical protein
MIYYLLLLSLFIYYMKYIYPRQYSRPPSPPKSTSTNSQVKELDINKYYHHPLWPTPWFHPDFTNEATQTWRKEPWYQENRLSQQFLYPPVPSKFPWGYIIYRTVYTPESDKLWPIAITS